MGVKVFKKMPDKETLEKVLGNIKNRHTKEQNSGLPPVDEVLHRVKDRNTQPFPHKDHHQIPEIYREGDLKSIILPLSEMESIIYIDNLLDKVINERRDKITGLQIYSHEDNLDTVQLCNDISQAILRYRENFPAEYDTSLSKKEKSIGWGLVSTVLPTSILEFFSKKKISPSGETTLEKSKILPGAADIIDKTKFGLGVAGGLGGAEIGSLGGPSGTVAGGIVGFIIGYFSPAIAGGAYIAKRKNIKKYEREEYGRIRNAILNISNQVRLQEVSIDVAILPDFRNDNVYPYLRREIVPFREPDTPLRDKLVYRGFKSVTDKEEVFNRATYNMQRYYRAKIRSFELPQRE